ncbi:MAG: hypothetical protein WCV72_04430 [Patescibacteria group bacterium]|jgi:hypothetical protein
MPPKKSDLDDRIAGKLDEVVSAGWKLFRGGIRQCLAKLHSQAIAEGITGKVGPDVYTFRDVTASIRNNLIKISYPGTGLSLAKKISLLEKVGEDMQSLVWLKIKVLSEMTSLEPEDVGFGIDNVSDFSFSVATLADFVSSSTSECLSVEHAEN